MRNRRTDRRSRSRTEIIATAIIFLGVVIMAIALYFGTADSLNTAQNTMERHISDLKKQCNDYDEFLTSDKIKSLMRLTEQAEDVGDTLALLPDEEKSEYLTVFMESQRLACILILDETLMPDSRIVTDKMGDYRVWKEYILNPSVSSLLTFPKKIFSARITHEGQTYDIAAAARMDVKGVIFCAMRQESDKLMAHYTPVKNLLASNETALGGSMYITEGNTVVASNSAQGTKIVSEIPEIAALAAAKNGGELTRFECNGTYYYGGSAKCRSYDIYVFYPSREIFAGCRSMIFLVLGVYVIAATLAITLYYRTIVSHNREMSRQYEIIRSISHIYVMTVIVDMRAGRFEILKYPEKWGEVSTSGPADQSFLDRFMSLVGEQYREGYLAFLNPQTIRQRLGSDDYVEYDYQDISGEWLNDKIIPQNRDENGEFDSFILARTSIGEQKKAELEYQEKLKTAARNEALANRSKTELLRRMSHDIRTPINVILGMLEIADRNPTDTTLLESCRSKGKAAAEYLLELVNDILTINKVDAGSAEEAESGSAFLLADAVQKLYIVTEERAKARGIKLEPPKISGEQKPLEGNTLYLRQIMMNIIANAVRYSHAGGTVRFSVSQMPSPEKEGFAEVRFVCEDNGIGMSREFQEKMFEPFSQESEAGSSRFGGVGLGLAIVQKLVQRLDGQISVESEKGVGTRFEIILPYKYADKPVEDKTEEREEISLHGLNILLVEDNELNMQIAEYMLTDAGANVIRAYNGREAVGYFACSAVGAVDAVLTDMTMPGMDGLEETRRIRAMDRADAKTVPIIALTANLFRQDMTACTDAGMTGFLSKPLNVGQLLKMISQQTKKGEGNDE